MSWTTPPTWTVGQALTSSEMNTYVTADLNFLWGLLTSLSTITVAGTLGEGATYTIVAPATGAYVLEYGASAMDSTSGTGNVKNITASTGGTQAVYSDTGSSGGIGIQSVSLTSGQTVTLTVNHVSGSSIAGLLGCWAKLTRVS